MTVRNDENRNRAFCSQNGNPHSTHRNFPEKQTEELKEDTNSGNKKYFLMPTTVVINNEILANDVIENQGSQRNNTLPENRFMGYETDSKHRWNEEQLNAGTRCRKVSQSVDACDCHRKNPDETDIDEDIRANTGRGGVQKSFSSSCLSVKAVEQEADDVRNVMRTSRVITKVQTPAQSADYSRASTEENINELSQDVYSHVGEENDVAGYKNRSVFSHPSIDGHASHDNGRETEFEETGITVPRPPTGGPAFHDDGSETEFNKDEFTEIPAVTGVSGSECASEGEQTESRFNDEQDASIPPNRKDAAERSDGTLLISPSNLEELDKSSPKRSPIISRQPTSQILPEQSTGKHTKRASASLSPRDIRSLAANRGGSPPQITRDVSQAACDPAVLSDCEILNSMEPPRLFDKVCSLDKKKQTLVRVPTLKEIISMKFERLTRNLHVALANCLKTANWDDDAHQFEDIKNRKKERFEKVTSTENSAGSGMNERETKYRFLTSTSNDQQLVKCEAGIIPRFSTPTSNDKDRSLSKGTEVKAQGQWMREASDDSRRTFSMVQSYDSETKVFDGNGCWEGEITLKSINATRSTELEISTDSKEGRVPVGSTMSTCILLVRIIHQIPEDRNVDHQTDWDITRPGEASYIIKMTGVSERQVRSRIKLLQEDFDSFFPSYRRWRYGERAAKEVEFYTINVGRNGAIYQRVCDVDVRGSDHGQCVVHQSKIQEVPQLVEVAQPRPGIISDVANDPPGQQSVYIPPGDHRKETYRLSTFESFPKQTPINAPDLAKNGFFYTGFYDRVKCYSCGRTVEHWAAGDNPSDKRWHKQDCQFARGVAIDNIPIGGLFSSAMFGRPSSGGASSSSAPQPMDVGPSQSQTYNIPRGADVTDLTRSHGTYQMLPNSTFVIGPTSVQTQQQPPRPQTNNPPARNPPRQWRMANVISSDHKRYLTNLYLNREIDRLASFCRWPTGRPNVAPVALARAGFFYLGDMDRTQCFSCGGVLRNWSADDDAMAEHRTHFPNCRIVAGVERRNVPVAEQAETPMELAEKYPCRFPMNPHMRSEQSRVATFDRRWPSERTRATAQEIAEAGFFFLGERDRVKCWYCNGGLQNWEYDDVPWIEHAKWFPNCQFLLAKQGQLFVYRYLSLSPHLPRPIIGRQDGSTVDPSQATLHTGAGQSSGGQDVAPASAPISRVRAPSPPPAIIDPQVELRKRRDRVEKELKENDMVKVVLAMGYEEDLVRKTLLDKLESGGAYDADSIYEGTAVLLEAVMEKETEIQREREEERATSIKFLTLSSSYSVLSAGSMDTSPSGPPSSIINVSGFYQDDEDDEDRDLYSSIGGGSSIAGAVGGITSSPSSIGDKAKVSHIWKDVPEDQESMKEFIEQKKEERLCKICFTETADMVFIPCSHMVCCMSCTEAIRHCPICRKKIEKAIKTYVK